MGTPRVEIGREDYGIDYLSLLNAKAEDFEKIGKKVMYRLMPKPGRDYKLYLAYKPELREGEKLIAYTQSACPHCLSLLNAVIYERDGKVWIRKKCPEHGEIEEVYWGDAELFKKFSKWQFDGKGVEPYVDLIAPCPYNCGLCARHKSHTALINLVATNRCDLSCWYCLPGDQEILVRLGHSVKLLSFEELARRYEFKHRIEVGEFRGEYAVPQNLEVLGFVSGHAKWVRVTKVLRRKYKGKVLVIRTSLGREVKVTPEHRMAVLKGGRIVKQRADRLKIGDKVLSISYTPILNEAFRRPVPLIQLAASSASTRSLTCSLRSLEISSRTREARFLGDFVIDSIAEIRHEDFEGEVYDLEVDAESHLFIAGDGLVISNCFFYAGRVGYVYEPTLEHIKYMIKMMLAERPVPPKAVQITGGEPTLRDDLVEIVRLLKEAGIRHVQVNTTGIKFAYDEDLPQKLRKAGTNVVYMSFDGVTPFTNPKNHWEVPYALENLRKAGLGVVLVPTLIKGYNTHELGLMIKFSVKHMDIVRGLNMQPVSITGRMPRKLREKERITIPEAIIEIEKQTDGQISREDWYPVPSVAPISIFIEALTGKPQLTFTTHFACGAATYVFKEGDELVPITRFVHVDEFMKYLEEKASELASGKSKKIVLLELALKLRKFVDWKNVPKSLKGKKFVQLLYNIFVKHDYKSLGEFHYKTLFLGMMHFQDLYNHDLARVQRCDIHYIMPDGRLIPFCSFNVLPQLYRDRAQKAFGIPIKKWEEIVGVRVVDYKYKRNIRKLIEGKVYREAYEGIIDVDSISYEEHVRASRRFGVPVVE